MKFFLLVISVVFNLGLSADDWITEEVLKQLTEIRQEVKLLRNEVSSLRKEIRSIRNVSNGTPSIELGDLPRLGSNESPLVIIEFSEYQCPFCSQHFKQTMPLLKRYYIDTGKMQYVVRDLPLSYPQKGRKAAIATRCAFKQNDKAYWSMHDELLGLGFTFNEKHYKDIAERLGLDLHAYSKCLKSKTISEEIAKDIAYAKNIGISVTPTFLIGKLEGNKVIHTKKIIGAQPYSVFSKVIDSYLK